MYQAFNDYLIAIKIEPEETTDTGIILTGVKESNYYQVEKTNENTAELQGKVIVPLAAQPLAKGFFAINYKDIIAVKE